MGSPQAHRAETLIARRLRRDMSPPEVLMWQRLRGGGAGVRFRRQHPIGPYVVDFYCAAQRRIVEIDGIAHDLGDRPMQDDHRDDFFRENGYRIVRIAALDVMRDADRVAAAIASLVESPLHHACGMVPLPVPGRI